MKFYRRLQRTKLCSLLKSKKGSVEFLSFIIVLPMALIITFNPIFMYFDMQKYNSLEDIAKKYCLISETEGGLTLEQIENCRQETAKLGYDINNIRVDADRYPVEFGREVRTRITVENVVIKRIKLKAGGLEDDKITIVAGPFTSISKKVTEW